MIEPTVLHNGYIMDEINRAAATPRYHELCHQLMEWHSLPGHDDEEPPEQIGAILAELKAMKLFAFAQAGRRYRLALEAYERRCEWERAARQAGLVVAADTAIEYVDGPPEPITIDFTHPA